MARLTVLFLVLSGVFVAGCGKNQDPMDRHGAHTHESTPMHGSTGTADHDGAAKRRLPEGANTVCPVMGGGVDAAIFAEHDCRAVYLCCDECIEKFKEDPEQYFKKAYPDAEHR